MKVKRCLVGGALAVVGVAGVLVSLAAADVLAELGLKEPEARERAMEALNSGHVNYFPAGKVLKAATPSAREALVKGALAWVRGYTESPEFKTAYARLRENRKPTPSASTGGADERVKQQRAEMEKAIAEAKKNLANLPANISPEMRKAMEEGMQQAITVMTAQLAELDKPASQAMMKQVYEAAGASEREQYQARVKEYEARYPADPRPFIARRLRQFLDESATVDFGAKLVAAGKTMRFADPRYEDKSSDWKLCYRAGKEPVSAARAFATAWLAELEKK
jgi:hypothetical protein